MQEIIKVNYILAMQCGINPRPCQVTLVIRIIKGYEFLIAQKSALPVHVHALS